METAKITSKGQITIPKKVREFMAVDSGDRLSFEFDEEGCVRMMPVRVLDKPLKGFLEDLAATRKLDESAIRKAIRKRAASKHVKK